jgi:hypothetical protein
MKKDKGLTLTLGEILKREKRRGEEKRKKARAKEEAKALS